MTRVTLVNTSHWTLENNDTIDSNYCTVWIQMLTLLDHKVLYATILLTFSPVAILLNLILIVSFISTKQVTQNTSNLVIFVLCFSDLIVGAVSMPLKSNILLNVTSNNSCMKVNILIFFNAFQSFSVMLTVLLAIDRYLHMNPCIQSRSSKLRKFMEKPRIYYLVVSLFIICMLLFGFNGFYSSKMMMFAAIITSLSLLSIHLIIVTCLYAKGYLRIRNFTDSNPVYCENTGSSGSTPDYVLRLYKTVLILILLEFFQYVSYCLIWITATVLLLLEKVHVSMFVTVGEFSALFMYAGCFTNCLAVLHFNKQARHWILKQLKIKSIEVTN